MSHRVQRVIGTAAALVGAASLVAGVQAADRPNDRSGMLGVGGVARATVMPSGVFERAVERHVAETLPDPLAQNTRPVRPDDRAGLRGVGVATPSSFEEADDRFAWSDAVFGAAVALALCLALGALAVTMIRQRGGPVVR